MRVLLLVLGLGLFPARPQDAEEQVRFVLGLAEQGMHAQVVREARAFLREHPGARDADEVRYRLAVALFELDEVRDAVRELAPLRDAAGFPRWREVLFRIGQCELALGEPARAAASLESLLERGAGYLERPATSMLADAWLAAGEFGRAEPLYAALLAPQDRRAIGEREQESEDAKDGAAERPDALWGLSWCAFRLGRMDAAKERVAAFLAESSEDERAGEMRFLLGEIELAGGRHAEALAAYRAAGAGPYADAALRGTGFALAGLGRHAEAAGAFERVLAEHAQSRFTGECALHAGVAHLKAGDVASARARLEDRALDGVPEALYWRARAQAEAGRHADALLSLDRAARGADPDLAARIAAARGDALSALGREDEAVREWRAAGSERGLYNAAVTSLEAGRLREAAELAEGLLAAPGERERADAALVLAEARFALEEYAAAERAFELALSAGASGGDAEHARLRIAWCRWLAGDPQGAAEAFEAVAASSPSARGAGGASSSAAEALAMLGRARLAAGDEAGAKDAWDDYLARCATGKERASVLLGRARLEHGARGAELLEELVREHARDPLAAEARLLLAERLSAAGECERAEALYREVLATGGEHGDAARYGVAWCRHQADAFGEAAALLREIAFPAGGSRRDPSGPSTNGKDASTAGTSTPDELFAAALELLVWCEAELGDADRVLRACEALLETGLDEQRIFGASQKALVPLRAARRTEDARALLEGVARRARSPAVAAGVRAEQAFLALDEARVDAAEAAVHEGRRLAAADARVAEAAFFVGEARFERGEHERAAALYDAAGTGGAQVQERALYKGGFALLAAGDLAGAELRFRRLADEHPASALRAEALFLAGEAQFRARRFDEAAETLEAVRRAAPDDAVMPRVLFRLGLAHGERGRWRECAETLAELARSHADFASLAEAELWRGRALARLGEGGAARRALARAIELAPGAIAAEARLELGKLARGEGDREGALSEFLKVAVLYDTEAVAEALWLAGEVLEEQGDREQALGRYAELVERRPESPFARRARERIEDLRVR